MAAERVSVCLQLTRGNPQHDGIIELLFPEGRKVNKSQILVDALLLYLASGGNDHGSPPPRDPDPVPPGGLVELAKTIGDSIRDGMREIAPAIGQAVASAVGTGFSVNRVEIPPDPVALEAGRKAALLADMMNGLEDWIQQ